MKKGDRINEICQKKDDEDDKEQKEMGLARKRLRKNNRKEK